MAEPPYVALHSRRPERSELEQAFVIADGLGLRRLDARSRRDAVGVG